MSERLTIAIDGPVAAGKTTVGRLVADALDAVAFDTGVLYRAVAYNVVKQEIDPFDDSRVANAARELSVDVRQPSTDDDRMHDVLIEGVDVTWKLRSPEIDRALPSISANPEVRKALEGAQRRIAASGRVVMIGRDIGTVILPDAGFKFFLDAPVESRACRRFAELAARGVSVSYNSVLRDLIERDDVDSSRNTAPLRPAPDAIRINTGEMSAQDVAGRIVDIVQRTVAAIGRGS